MKEKLLQFLKALEHAIVPPAGYHHSITYSLHDGEEYLRLGVWTQDSTRLLFLADGDLEKPVDELVAEIQALCKAGLGQLAKEDQ
jgi:hypothetical protein